MKYNLFDQPIEHIARGYVSDDNCHICLVCQQTYDIGQIYEYQNTLYDAKKRMELHIQDDHKGMANYLLECNPDVFGVSNLQMQMLQMFGLQLSDKEIASRQGIALSTIRNYRYKLREKEKQSRMFLALMQLIEQANNKSVHVLENSKLADAPVTATTLDMRFNITDAEKEKFKQQYFNEYGALLEYPAKAKRKVIVLEVIAKNFKSGVFYTEVEINRILKRIYEDNVTIRRALIEYGFLDRSDDGSKYWVNE